MQKGERTMKTIKTIAKALITIYLILSIIATIAVNLGCYDVLSFKGALTVVQIQPAQGDQGLTIYQSSPFCNDCDVFAWLIEFQPDGTIRTMSDGLACFGQY